MMVIDLALSVKRNYRIEDILTYAAIQIAYYDTPWMK